MIVHDNVELLSSLVDDELEQPVRREVERHLKDCAPCRERLRALRQVVDGLSRLEESAPPPALAARVRRAVSLEPSPSSPLRRGEQALRRWIDQPLLLPLFGVVTALAIFLYLLTAWVGSGVPGTRLVVPERAAPAAAGEGGETVVREIEGRRFGHSRGRWVEEGVEPESIDVRLDLAQPLAGREELEPFRELGGRVVLRHEGRVLEIDFGD